MFGRATPTWDTEVNFGDEAVGAACKFPHPSPLPKGEGTDRLFGGGTPTWDIEVNSGG
ncbi:hypothetical protein EMIT0P265_10277 [Pseudomonas zeae]